MHDYGAQDIELRDNWNISIHGASGKRPSELWATLATLQSHKVAKVV